MHPRASDGSPRRQPWVGVIQEPSPGRGERIRMGDKLLRLVFRPSGADSSTCLYPTADAMGYYLAALRG
jgi:hypothetical protein